MAKIVRGSEVLKELRSHIENAATVKVVSPFVSRPGARLLLRTLPTRKTAGSKLSMIVRFDDRSIGTGVCDPNALKEIAEGCRKKNIEFECRQILTIHAKMVLVERSNSGKRYDLIGSANLTYAGLAEYDSKEACAIVTDADAVRRDDEIWASWWREGRPVRKTAIEEWIQRQPELQKKYESEHAPALRACIVRGTERSYTRSLSEILAKAGSGDGIPVDALAADLEEEEEAAGEQQPDPMNLAKFLRYVGLVEIEGKTMRTTTLGTDVLTESKGGHFETLYRNLSSRYPMIEHFRDSLSPKSFRTYKEAIQQMKDKKVRSRFLLGANVNYGTASPVKNWLRGMGMVVQQSREANILEFKRTKKSSW